MKDSSLNSKGARAPSVAVRVLTVLAAAAVVFGASTLAVAAGYPQGFSTYSLLPLILWAVWESAAVFIVLSLVFCVWCAPQLSGSLGFSKSIKWILYGTGLLSLICFVSGWQYGLTYQGKDTVMFWSFLSAVPFFVLLRFIVVPAESENWFRVVWLKCLLFVWATCWALPYLGETP